MRFNVKFNHTDQKLHVKFEKVSKAIDINFEGLQQITGEPEVEIYTGSYEITPKVDAQTMTTAQKFMTDNVTVKAIPFYDVSNTAGGKTIYIGNEV